VTRQSAQIEDAIPPRDGPEQGALPRFRFQTYLCNILSTKQATLMASQGALTSNALGTLRQQERNYQVAQEGIGVKGAAITAANQRNAATNAQSNTNNLRNNAQSNINNIRSTTTSAANAAARGAKPGSAPKGLTLGQQNGVYNSIDTLQSLVAQGLAAGHPESAIRAAAVNGTLSPKLKAQSPIYIDAAFELNTYGHILPTTAAQLHQIGLRGGRYQVGPAGSPGGLASPH
jgi:hypothetical protein